MNDTLKLLKNFNSGKLHGEWKSFYMNGKPKEIGLYKNGEKVGEWIYYNEKGEVIKNTIDKNN